MKSGVRVAREDFVLSYRMAATVVQPYGLEDSFVFTQDDIRILNPGLHEPSRRTLGHWQLPYQVQGGCHHHEGPPYLLSVSQYPRPLEADQKPI